MGLWVWRPAGVSTGTLLVKSGPVLSLDQPKAWSSLIVKIVDGFAAVTACDGKAIDGFKLISKDPLTVDGWTHVAYTIDTHEKKVKIYINGALSNVGDLNLMMWCADVSLSTTERVIETDHEYADDMRQYWLVKEPGAVKYSVTCDPRSSTESGCDYLRFYKGTTRSEVIGESKYTGKTFPG